jgi:hypothetical protein
MADQAVMWYELANEYRRRALEAEAKLAKIEALAEEKYRLVDPETAQWHIRRALMGFAAPVEKGAEIEATYYEYGQERLVTYRLTLDEDGQWRDVDGKVYAVASIENMAANQKIL